jgi:hypothetical protein
MTRNYEAINSRLLVHEKSLRNRKALIGADWNEGLDNLEARLMEQERVRGEDLQGMLFEAKRMLEEGVEPLVERIRCLEEFQNAVDMHAQPAMQVEVSLFEELQRAQPSNHVANFAAIYSWMCLMHTRVLGKSPSSFAPIVVDPSYLI